MPDNSFSKSEHLCGDKVIAHLYDKGDAFIAYPLRVVYLLSEQEGNEFVYPLVMVSVPKKKFKRANKRNRIKRLMREAYRLNKQHFASFLQERNVQLTIAFNYVGNEEVGFSVIEAKMVQIAEKIQKKSFPKAEEATANSDIIY